MRFQVTVKPGAKEDKIFKGAEGYTVSLKAQAQEGKANAALVKLFWKELKWRVRIVRGVTSRKKLLETEDI